MWLPSVRTCGSRHTGQAAPPHENIQIGYVANSPYTVIGESMSAGRIYDKIGDEAAGTVLYVLPKGVLCILGEHREE